MNGLALNYSYTAFPTSTLCTFTNVSTVHYLFSHLLLQVDHKQENSKLINYTSSHESSTKEKSMQATSKSSLQS